MCGIAGILSSHTTPITQDQIEQVAAMLVKMNYRGPDDLNVHQHGSTTIGNCRLSIVDIAHGRQPLTSACSNWAITFNGEIYNFRELYACLNDRHTFKSQSDTELIMHLFEELGTDCLSRLNGMFAICLTNGETTYLIRDRFGVKPIYYRFEKNCLIFASEVKAILPPQRELNIEMTYAQFENNIGHETLFKGIFEVPPGSYLKFDSGSRQVAIHTYYSLAQSQTQNISENQAVEKMRWLVKDAVRIRTDTDLPYGCFVSGGLDSTIVTCLSTPQLLLSAVVPDRAYLDEQKYILELEKYKEQKVSQVQLIPSQFPRYFAEMVYSLDFPTTTLAAYVQFVLSKIVRENGLRIMLNGLGADEYLGGYMRHVALMFAGQAVLQKDEYHHYAHLFAKLPASTINQHPHEMYYKLISRSHNNTPAGQAIIRRLFNEQTTLMNSLAAVDLAISFPPLLRTDDRLNMYFGIETRSPFLDYRIVEFAFTLVDSLKIRQDHHENAITKYILRQAFADRLPHKITNRVDKIGFPSPVALWLNLYFKYAVKRAYTILEDISPIRILFPPRLLSESNEFSRKQWQLLQWAAWYLLFFEQLSIDEVTNILFSLESPWRGRQRNT